MKLALNLVLAVVLSTALLSLLAVTVMPRVLGWQFLTVLTPSMTPTIGVRAIIAVRPAQPLTLRERDIIAYHPPGQPSVVVTHRVVRVIREGGAVTFKTRGDANNTDDAYDLRPGDVVGRVMFHVPLAGYAFSFVKTPTGFFATLVISGFILGTSELVKAVNRLKSSAPHRSTLRKRLEPS